MKTTTMTMGLLLAGAALAASTAAAQGPTAPPGERQRPPKPPVDLVLDADGDEVISAREIAAAATALDTLDADGDGRLTLAECLPAPPGGAPPPISSRERKGAAPGGPGAPGGRHPLPPIFVALDTGSDQALEADEIAAAPSALATLDRDGDGRLTPEEYRPHPPAGSTGSRGEGPRGNDREGTRE